MTKRDRIVRDILWQVAATLNSARYHIEPDRVKNINKLYALLDKLEDLK